MSLQKAIFANINNWGDKKITTYYPLGQSYVTKDELSPKFNQLIPQIKPVGIADGELTYFSPLCKIPRYKIDNFINENKLNIPKTYTLKLADKLILDRKATALLLNPRKYTRYIKVPVSYLYDRGLSITDTSVHHDQESIPLSKIKCEYVLFRTGSSHDKIDFSQFLDVEIIVVDTVSLEKEYKFLFDLCNNLDKCKFIVGEDDEILKQTNKELILDEDIYNSLRDMLSSKNYENHKIAKELIANCDFEKSKIYLLLLLHEFNSSLFGGQKTPNYAVFLDKFKSWKLNSKINWFNYGLQLLKQFPDHKQVIKKFLVVRFNKLAGQEVLTNMIFKDEL
jgi:cellulose synthase/poly-beta-1,6-N-acetylglucosamine synthase-like glycosyltransferase